MNEPKPKSYVMLVCYSFFSVCLFFVFLFPIIKIDTSVIRISYNVYEFVEEFSENGELLHEKLQVILNCCYALFAFGGAAILVTVYSVIKSLNKKEGYGSILMVFICLAIAIIAITIIINMNAINEAENVLIGKITQDLGENNIVAGDDPSMNEIKNIIQIGACPIILIVVPTFLIFLHFISYVSKQKKDESNPN